MYMRGYSDKDSNNIEVQKIISSWSPDNDDTYLTTRHGKVKRKTATKRRKTTEPDEEPSSQSPGPSEEATRPTPGFVSWDHSYAAEGTIPSVALGHITEPSTPQSSPDKTSSYSTSDLLDQHNYFVNPKTACTCSCLCEKCQEKQGK